VLVLYYIVGLHITWLQSRAEMGDYIIGACLFFFATILLFSIIRRFSATNDLRPPALPQSPSRNATAPASFFPRWIALLLVLMVGSITYARALVQQYRAPQGAVDPSVLGVFPQQVGNYTLQRRWNEYIGSGTVLFYWADYRPAAGGSTVSIGVSPVLGAHDSLVCHAARGEQWLWHGNLDVPTASEPISFSASFFNTGATQYLEATTICTGATCGQFSNNNTHFGLVYSRPDAHTLLTQSPTRPIPILIRTETLDTQMSADAARAELTENLRSFLSAADVSSFSSPYRQSQ